MSSDSSSIGCIITTIIIVAIIAIITISSVLSENKREEKMYQRILTENTIEAISDYKRNFQNGRYYQKVEIREKEIREKIKEENLERERLNALKWSTDRKAWNEAKNNNTAWAYKKYIELYPKGNNVKLANKLLIDREVDNIMGGDYGEIPSMEKNSTNVGSNSTVSVTNNTSYSLTIRYSGKESEIIVIPPHITKSTILKNGSYRIAASVNASSVRSFAGTESLTGGDYNVTYYIQTSRY